MDSKKAIDWNRKASIVYAVGVWTMIGSYVYLHYTGKFDLSQAKPPAKEENLNEVVYETAHTKSVIVYKDDFVPYRIRIMNFLKSFIGGKSSADSDNNK